MKISSIHRGSRSTYENGLRFTNWNATPSLSAVGAFEAADLTAAISVAFWMNWAVRLTLS